LFYEPSTEAISDAELLAAHLAEDPHAFNELGRRHRDRLWAIAATVLRHPQDADDATQAALLRAFRHASKFRGDSSVFVWLRTITINVSTTMAAQRAQMNARLVDEEAARHRPDGTSSRAVESVELHHLVREALLQLPEDFRAAFVLRILLDLSVDQVAKLQCVSPGTIKSRVNRAKKLLIEQLGFREVIALLRGVEDGDTSPLHRP
jgi:RNA polymerase sigma-70 factor (ECF subfamily)